MTASTAGQAPANDRRRAGRDRLLADLTVVEPSPAQRRRAAIAVCRFNPDPAEARDMLAALGLLSDDSAQPADMPVAS